MAKASVDERTMLFDDQKLSFEYLEKARVSVWSFAGDDFSDRQGAFPDGIRFLG